MRIEVTQDHINRGYVNCTHCPVALAIHDVTRMSCPPVDGGHIYLGIFSGLRFSFPTPDPVVSFIRDFDNGRPVEPFFFELDIPSEYLKTPTT